MEEDHHPQNHSPTVPIEFIGPFTDMIMKDPVILSTGETYDRAFIEYWFSSGNKTCPLSRQILINSSLTPNKILHRIISNWCSNHGGTHSTFSSISRKLPVTNEEQNVLNFLVNSLPSPSLHKRIQSVKGLQVLLKYKSSVQAFVGQKANFVANLLAVLSLPGLESGVVAILHCLSLHEANQLVIGSSPEAIRVIVEAMAVDDIKHKAVQAMLNLAALPPNKIRFGASGAVESLVTILENDSREVQIDAARAISALCEGNKDNRRRARAAGAPQVLIQLVRDREILSDSVKLLALFSRHKNTKNMIQKFVGIESLLVLLSDTKQKNDTENLLVIIWKVFTNRKDDLKHVQEEEDLYGTISQHKNFGSSRARRYATKILKKLEARKLIRL